MIEVRGVTFGYPGQRLPVLQDISFEVTPGDFLVILGRNGSGKSTLAKLMNGLLLPGRGQVQVDGMDTSNYKQGMSIRQKVGLLFSNPDNQLVSSVVEEDVAFGPENLGIESAKIEERVREALRLVSMEDYSKHPPHLLSGGQKQRVAIAGILALRPDYMVLDEPTAMLDPQGREEILATLLRLNREHGTAIILITHLVEEALAASRIMVLGHGTVAMHGTPADILVRTRELEELGLEPPDMVLLIEALRDKGYSIPPMLSEKELAEYILRRKM